MTRTLYTFLLPLLLLTSWSAYAQTPPTIVVAPAVLPNGTQGIAYSQTFTASGGTAPYTFAITAGALPAGLSLTGATLAGTPTTDGSVSFTITATDASASPGPYSGSRSYTLAIAVTTWNGSINTDWFTAANWTPSNVPTTTTNAIIPVSASNFPFISAGTATVRNLTLNSGASFTQSGGTLDVRGNLTNNGTYQPTGGTVVLGTSTQGSILGSSNTRFWNLRVDANGAQQATSATTSVQRLLTLNGNFTTNGNPFTLESNTAFTAMVINTTTNVVNGNVTVQRYINSSLNANLGYRHVSVPVSNATVSSLTTASYTPVVNANYNTSATPGTATPFPTVYGYDQSRLATTTNNLSTFDKGWYSPLAISDPLTVGQGYAVLLAANQTWSFTGPLNNGNVTLNLARNSGATAADAGLHLVGNPYPSPLDWSQVAAAERPGMDGIILAWRSNDPANPYAGSYGFFNNGIGTMSPVLAQGQGFFVRVTAGQTSGTINLKNTHRPPSYNNPTYQRMAETRPIVHLTLQGLDSTLTDDAFVYFEQGATAANDGKYDAEKVPNPSGLNLATSLSATQRLCIDGRPLLGASQLIVPLAVGVPATGSYTLSAAELLNLGTTPTYLRDLQTGAVVDLALQPDYHFTVSNSSTLVTGRFELVFSPNVPLKTSVGTSTQQPTKK
jgi:hypothetical protein